MYLLLVAANNSFEYAGDIGIDVDRWGALIRGKFYLRYLKSYLIYLS